MSDISREKLHAYLDDALCEADNARVEQGLRDSEPLRRALRSVMAERDRGEHSLGAIWRRERVTCPDRDKLGSFLLGVLDDDEQDYLGFHLDVVGCPFCQANRADLQHQAEAAAPAARRRRIFESSAGLLRPPGK
ncbi:MAG: hypothetical protein ACRC33_18760 [Gemmataceae bacterium]